MFARMVWWSQALLGTNTQTARWGKICCQWETLWDFALFRFCDDSIRCKKSSNEHQTTKTISEKLGTMFSNASFSGYFQWRNILAFLFFGFRSFQTSENLHQHYNVPVACQGIGMDDNLREVQHVQETVGIPKDGQLPAGFDRAKSSDSWMGVVGEDLVKGVFKTICVVFGLELFIK